MSPEAQRIAIAEACGWTECRPRASVTDRPWLSGYNPSPDKVIAVFGADGVEMDAGPVQPETLPDYLSDLNAMHEAEKVLDWDEQASTQLFNYRCYLAKICGNDKDLIFHATAAQRAEAFLRTLNLWKP